MPEVYPNTNHAIFAIISGQHKTLPHFFQEFFFFFHFLTNFFLTFLRGTLNETGFEHLKTYMWYLKYSNKTQFRIGNDSRSIFTKPNMAHCGTKNSLGLFYNVSALKQSAERWITVSSSRLQKEQSLVSHFLKI